MCHLGSEGYNYGDGKSLAIETLSEYFRMVQIRKGLSTREIAKELDMNCTTVWRTITHPSRASGIALMKLVKWSEIDWKDFEKLFENELRVKDNYR